MTKKRNAGKKKTGNFHSATAPVATGGNGEIAATTGSNSLGRRGAMLGSIGATIEQCIIQLHIFWNSATTRKHDKAQGGNNPSADVQRHYSPNRGGITPNTGISKDVTTKLTRVQILRSEKSFLRAEMERAATLYARFAHSGVIGEIDQAIGHWRNAISLTPEPLVDRPAILHNLGCAYQVRFQCLGRLEDLIGAIGCGTHAVLLTLDGHVDKPSRLNALGLVYRYWFEHQEKLLYLNRAIDYTAEAVSLTPNDDEAKAGYLSNLGNSYRIRFDYLGEQVDLNKAIEYGSQAVSLTPDRHADKPGRVNNLGISYQARFEILHELCDLDRAIGCVAEAVSLTPDGFADKWGMLVNLGTSYRTRFEHLGERSDVDRAIECVEQADVLTPSNHIGKPGIQHSLSLGYRARFTRLGELTDLNKAIDCGLVAVSLTPDVHPSKPGYLDNLGRSYSTRFPYSKMLSDLDSAIASFRDAAQSSVGSPSSRFEACRRWAEWSSIYSPSSLYHAYSQAMQLLPQLIWIGTTLTRRYSLIKELGNFASEAASYAITINNHELALEWLEASRSIIWGQIAQLRTSFDQLSGHNPDLADKLKEVGRKLEYAGSQSSSGSSFNMKCNDQDPNEEASSRILLAHQWDELLGEVRSTPGFEDFLRPPRSSQLLCASKSYPVVIVNVHESRCDALILQPNTRVVSHIPLVNFSVQNAFAAHGHLASLVGHRGFNRVRKSKPGPVAKPLEDLWSGVVKPVLDFLDYSTKLPVDQLPRITWCTTGILSFLPLHAAGCGTQSQLHAFDFVISSYTPTISALIASRSASTGNPYCGILAVGQEHTPGFAHLPWTNAELTVIRKHAQAGRYMKLEDDEATVGRVLDAMEQFSWVHMACHGTQNPADPTQSAFHLHDGQLTLATITKQTFHNKGLAFLSACQTATGDEELPDEAVHLAAGMLMAGYPSVIGTMWSIEDEDGPEIAEKVYAELMNNGSMDYTNAARALHQAVAHLRAKVGASAVTRWAPFVHIGC